MKLHKYLTGFKKKSFPKAELRTIADGELQGKQARYGAGWRVSFYLVGKRSFSFGARLGGLVNPVRKFISFLVGIISAKQKNMIEIPQLRWLFSNGVKGGLTVLISVLIIYGIVQAGSLTPSASPAATSYTLSNIYTRLTTNATSTAANHVFSPSASPAGTLYTLTQIYDVIPTIVANTVKLGTSYLGVSGTLTPDGGTAAVGDLFNGKTAHLTNDWTLDTGTLNLACNTATFDGTGNLVAGAYDGAGTGLNRWCITDSGDAVVGDILSGKVAWVDGVSVTGTIPTQILSAASETVAAGYYNATTLSAVDADLAAGNILSGKTIFGIAGNVTAGYTYGDNNANFVLGTATGAGTALVNLFNGTGQGFTGGSQANGGVDDYNNTDTAPSDRYSKGWTSCTNGADNYCGTGDPFADMKDNSTGLVWSKPCSGSGCSTSAEPANTTYSWDNSAVNNSSKTASELCSQDLGTTHDAGWSLPHQKQLMQAYIDGSSGNLEASGVNRYYWSATTISAITTSAWITYLSYGLTNYVAKTNSGYYVRCVRSAI